MACAAVVADLGVGGDSPQARALQGAQRSRIEHPTAVSNGIAADDRRGQNGRQKGRGRKATKSASAHAEPGIWTGGS